MAINFPNILILNGKDNPFKDTKSFNLLKKANIFHDNYKSASKFINNLDSSEKIFNWWYSNNTQKVVNVFCNKHAKFKSNITNNIKNNDEMKKFIIRSKKSIQLVPRSAHWVKNREGYVTMERNERVDDFKSSTMNILKNISSFDFRTYPDTNLVYKNLSKWLSMKEENLILTEGADGGLLRIFNVFVDHGDKVLTLEPGYAMYPVYCQMFKANYIPLKLSSTKIDNYFSILKEMILKNKPKIVAIANPNQPIEVMLSYSQLEQICKITKKTNSIFVVDEAYYHFNNVTAKNLIKKYNNLIVVRTFSKAFGLAGLRVGYSISNKKNIDFMKSIKPIYEINSINIKIILFFIKNLKIMKNYVIEVNRSRKILMKFFKKFNINVFGKYSNTVLIEFPNEHLAEKIVKTIYQKIHSSFYEI